jgi:hypothetical protein
MTLFLTIQQSIESSPNNFPKVFRNSVPTRLLPVRREKALIHSG